MDDSQFGIEASLERIGERIRAGSDQPSGESVAPGRRLAPVEVEDPNGPVEASVKPPPPPAELLAFTPRLFTQLALPYRDPGDVSKWVRRNGALELVVRPGLVVDGATGERIDGFPYGVVPRLLVIWMAGEVNKHRCRELYLGPSLGRFLSWMGLNRGGKQAARVRDQMTRLFGATITVDAVTGDESIAGWAMSNIRVARSAALWWHHSAPQRPLAESTVLLSEEFYESILDGSVPLDRAALGELRFRTRSPLALDIYAWTAHRLPRVKNPTLARWSELAVQFGGDYAEVRKFKRDFLKELAHVRAIYPAARVEPGPAGLVLRRSPSPVPPRRALSR